MRAALGLDAEIGSIEVGKQADLILIDAIVAANWRRRRTPSPPSSMRRTPGDVSLTMVDGEILVRDGAPLHLDAAEIAAEARCAGGGAGSKSAIILLTF